MKTCLKSDAPESFKQYQEDNPIATWEQFQNECQEGYKQLQEQLRKDQGNLCCYCEIDTKKNSNDGKDDFRVEHFHPKANKKDTTTNNWALDWNNMLGCCHGGTEPSVTDSKTRFISREKKNQRHSDVLKGNFIWDDEILNPLEIPAFPILFKTDRKDGILSVIDDNCKKANIDIVKANNCLDTKKLNLNSSKLKELRKITLDKLNSMLGQHVAEGLTDEQAITILVESQLCKNENGYWNAFFTTIRSYFGKAAEIYLEKTHYHG